MRCIVKLKQIFKKEEINCGLNPFIKDYYDNLEPEFYDEAIKNIRSSIKDNNIYANFLRQKIKENKKCTDFYNTSKFEDLLKREILEKEYSNNTAKLVLEYLKHKKEEYKTLKNEKRG
ncbi:MAG: hypothetical protein E7313_04705 [Clostridiales bacterium]|nr:hypothetical protein [Clostridiales bacterium]